MVPVNPAMLIVVREVCKPRKGGASRSMKVPKNRVLTDACRSRQLEQGWSGPMAEVIDAERPTAPYRSEP
jgi:hypothetical protein